MSVQTGNRSFGYDPTPTVSEKIATLTALVAAHVANGREGTAQIQAARQQIADLQAGQTAHLATQTRAAADLAKQAATCKGTVAPVYGVGSVPE